MGELVNNNKLALKLLAILEHMDSVPKNGYNKHQSYHYMREVDVMEALKKELVKHKIIMLTSSKFVDIQKKEAIKNGETKTEFVTTVETTHTFVDAETGEQHTITSVGSGYDSSDKGASKAITASFKYAITKTFMISDEGADIENDGESKAKPVKTTPSKIGASPIKIGAAAVEKEKVDTSAKLEPKVAPVVEVVSPEVKEEVKAAPAPKAEPVVKATQIQFAKRATTPAPQARKQEPGF